MARQVSLKQLAINKDNSTIVIVVALATFFTIFSIIASKSLLGQSSYQSKVIKKKQAAVKQLKSDVAEVKQLDSSYQKFASQPQNIIGGSNSGNGDTDGDNARIVLDALPSKYDFPALATSLQKTFRSYSIESITGTDDEIAQSSIQPSNTPAAVEIPFTIVATASTDKGTEFLNTFERSIRPIQIDKLTLVAENGGIKFNVDAKTYFQQTKTFSVSKEVVSQ